MTVYEKQALVWAIVLVFTCTGKLTFAQFTGSLSGGFASQESKISIIGIDNVLEDSIIQLKIWPNPCSDFFSVYSNTYLDLTGFTTDGKLFLDNVIIIPEKNNTFSATILSEGFNILNLRKKDKSNYFITLIKN